MSYRHAVETQTTVIFGPQMIVPILRREKTQTRRRRPLEQADCRYKPGRLYSVQPGRGQRAIASIEVTDVRGEQLGRLTPDDARAEGFDTVDAFEAYWQQLHGRYDPTVPVWVISFELAFGEAPTRWLTQAGAGGYTTDRRAALRDEPPAIDADAQEWLTYRSHRANDARISQRLRDRRRHSLERRLRVVRQLAALAAKTHGYDASSDMRVIERRIAKLERDLASLAP